MDVVHARAALEHEDGRTLVVTLREAEPGSYSVEEVTAQERPDGGLAGRIVVVVDGASRQEAEQRFSQSVVNAIAHGYRERDVPT